MELSQDAPATPAPDVPLVDEIKDTLLRLRPSALAEGEQIDQACRDQAEAVMRLLMDRGHYLPGAPPAQRILEDAKSFAERLTLSNLTARIIAMLYTTAIETPESKPAKRWIDDYLEGRNHGPIGKPMLWPARLPGTAAMLRSWGFIPTPTMPPFVARQLANPTPQ